MIGAYAGQPHDAIVATLRTLQHFRAFIASPFREMRDPYDRSWGSRLTREQAQQKLTSLIHVAINRKAGLVDVPGRKWTSDYQRGLVQDAAELNHPRLIIRQLRTPELARRFAARIEHGRSV